METNTPFSVLIVDDNHDIVKTTAELLQLSGFVVRMAMGGAEAIAEVVANPPDVILLDLLMPQVDGYEVARQVRAMIGIKPPVIIAVTACCYPLDIAQTSVAGFHLHLAKPVEPGVLLGVLERIQRAIA